MAFLSVELWDLVVEVLHFREAQEDWWRKKSVKTQPKVKGSKKNG